MAAAGPSAPHTHARPWAMPKSTIVAAHAEYMREVAERAADLLLKAARPLKARSIVKKLDADVTALMLAPFLRAHPDIRMVRANHGAWWVHVTWSIATAHGPAGDSPPLAHQQQAGEGA